HIGLHRLPGLLRHYVRAHPEVRLDLHFLDSEQAYQGVLDGQLEIAAVTLAPRPDPQLRVVPVWIDQLCFVCAPDHALAGAGTLSLAHLCEYDAVLPGSMTFTR